MAAVANAVGDPGEIDLAEEIHVRTALASGVDDPLRTSAEVVIAIDHGAEQICILDDDRFRACKRGVLERDLTTRDRAVIVETERPFLARRVIAHELRYVPHAVVRGESHRERRL